MRRPSTRRANGRALVAAVALVCAGLEVFGLLHRSLVPHGICPEHGEVVHASTDGGASAHELALAADPCATVRSLPTHESPDEHEHCIAVAARTAARRQRLGLAIADAGPVRPPAIPAVPPRDRTAILRVAPKSSPPA